MNVSTGTWALRVSQVQEEINRENHRERWNRSDRWASGGHFASFHPLTSHSTTLSELRELIVVNERE